MCENIDEIETYCPMSMANPNGPRKCIDPEHNGICYMCPFEQMKGMRNSLKSLVFIQRTAEEIPFHILMRECYANVDRWDIYIRDNTEA